MQTVYLQYMVEIERTRSITQAAANLYLSQPNLSRILHEIEDQLGYALFERSNRGVRPTEAGTAFLRHARRILAEMQAIEDLGVGKRQSDRFRVCMPRSAGILEMAIDYLNGLPGGLPLDAVLRECHVRQAIDQLAAGESDLAIIRFRSEYQDYFEDQAASRRLGFEALNGCRYRVIMHRDHPLAQKPEIALADLEGLTEITHGDTFRSRAAEKFEGRRLYSVDRHAQLTLVARIPNAYMWSTSVRPQDLEHWQLAQRDVVDNRVEYRNAMISIEPNRLNDIEARFMEYARQRFQS